MTDQRRSEFPHIRLLNPDEMAQLEFLYIEVLDGSEHGIPNLEGQIARSPDAFVQVLALPFKRSDDAQDPPEWHIEDPERRARLASAAHDLLHQIKHAPGTGTDGKIDTEVLFDLGNQGTATMPPARPH